MTKKEFLDKLSFGLTDISEEERNDILNYYDELIEDKKDNCFITEEEAIEELGSIEDIIKKVKPQTTINKTTNPQVSKPGKKKRIFKMTVIVIILSILLSVTVSLHVRATVFAVKTLIAAITQFSTSLGNGIFLFGLFMLIIGIVIFVVPFIYKFIMYYVKYFKNYVASYRN